MQWQARIIKIQQKKMKLRSTDTSRYLKNNNRIHLLTCSLLIELLSYRLEGKTGLYQSHTFVADNTLAPLMHYQATNALN